MKDILHKLLGSLDTHTKSSFSARKLTALASISIGAYVTLHELPEDTLLHALYAWQLTALLCLGIITFEQVIKFKNGGNNEPSIDGREIQSETGLDSK